MQINMLESSHLQSGSGPLMI